MDVEQKLVHLIKTTFCEYCDELVGDDFYFNYKLNITHTKLPDITDELFMNIVNRSIEAAKKKSCFDFKSCVCKILYYFYNLWSHDPDFIDFKLNAECTHKECIEKNNRKFHKNFLCLRYKLVNVFTYVQELSKNYGIFMEMDLEIPKSYLCDED